MRVLDVISVVDKVFPLDNALSWDNCGLQVGDPYAKVSAGVVCLDVTDSVLEEALNLGANLIISHHPLIFSPLKALDFSTALGGILNKLVKHDINVCSFHTNVDVSEGGLADFVCSKLGVEVEGSITPDGLGRYGRLKDTISFGEFIDILFERMNVSYMRVAGSSPDKVTKVAVCPGSGGDLIKSVLALNVDCYITGDVKYHHVAGLNNISVIDIGHYYSEIVFCELMKNMLCDKVDFDIFIYDGEGEPFKYISRGG